MNAEHKLKEIKKAAEALPRPYQLGAIRKYQDFVFWKKRYLSEEEKK